ncbi:ABC transporter ATP-binding protein [Glaciecola sp. 2405UD65-10]|uniref:ABC transporter ATP-binding protein n=1 Tax=Glaciecola sp. 2405UD65-10 TaxID=3397244 RepID=UPI003B5CFA0C
MTLPLSAEKTASAASNKLATEPALLSISNLHLGYGSTCVLQNVNLVLEKGEIGCVLGPSGSGKTSLLRAIAGFLPLQNGEIYIYEQCVSSATKTLAPKQRSVGVVFQDFALFPHMTVAENIAFGLAKLDAQTRKQRVNEYMKITGIGAFENVYPAELSGGQQQRVAIARAIAPQPDLLLMDEAFSSLDPSLREQIAQDIRRIIKSLGLTAILVTHDQTEAFSFADKIAVVANQQLQQYSSAYDLYHEPETYFVANFIGEGAFINGVVNIAANKAQVNTALGVFTLQAKQVQQLDLVHQQTIRVLLRPDDLIHDDASPTKTLIEETNFRGAYIRYQLRIQSSQEKVLCFAPSHHNHKVGEHFGVRANVEHVICFP